MSAPCADLPVALLSATFPVQHLPCEVRARCVAARRDANGNSEGTDSIPPAAWSVPSRRTLARFGDRPGHAFGLTDLHDRRPVGRPSRLVESCCSFTLAGSMDHEKGRRGAAVSRSTASWLRAAHSSRRVM